MRRYNPANQNGASDDSLTSPQLRRIIVADDDTPMRELVATGLRRDGYLVDEARSGSELLALVADRALEGVANVDLIVSDHRMPTVTGLEVANGLRRGGWDIPVILMTAFGDSALHADAELAGVVAVFDKPFELDDLRTVAAIVLSNPSTWGRTRHRSS